MKVDNKRIVRNTVFLYFRMLLTMFIGLFTVRIVLKALGDEDYGIYNVVGGVVTMMAFLNNALSSTTQRFLSYELGAQNGEKMNRVFATSMSMYAGLCIVIFLFAETLGLWFINTHLNIPANRMCAANWVYQSSIVSFLCSIMQAPYNAVIISHEKMDIFAYVSIGEVVIKLLMILGLLYITYDKLIFYAIMMSVISIVVLLFYKIYCNKNFKESRFVYSLDRGIAHELFSFAGWSIWGALSNIFKGQGVNIVLNMFFGVIVNTARGIAFQLDNAINTLVQNFYVAVKPQIIKLYSAKEYSDVRMLVHFTTRLGYFLILIPTIIFIFEMDEVLMLWLGYVPMYASVFTQLVLLCNVILALATPLTIVIHASGKVASYQFLSGLTYMLVLPFVYFAIKITDSPIQAFVVAIPFTIVYYYICYYFAAKYINIQYVWYLKLLRQLCLVTILSLIAPFGIVSLVADGLFRLLILSATTLFVTAIAAFFVGMTPNERNSIIISIQKIWKK